MNRICYHCEGCKDQEKGASGKEFLAASYHERRRERDEEMEETVRQRKRRWKEDGAEPHGLEKPQVARDLIAGE